MILYRVLSRYELNTLQGIEPGNPPSTLKGNNTFNYTSGNEYMHFFKYAEHAQKHKSKFGICIARVDIPEELINQWGFGFYGGNKDMAPEYIIKKEDFNKNFIIEIEKNIKPEWTFIDNTNVTYDTLYQQLLNECEKFYKKRSWEYASVNIYIAKNIDVRALDQLLRYYLKDEKRSVR